MSVTGKLSSVFGALVLSCLFFTGCGKQGAEPSESEPTEEQTYDLAAEEWKGFSQVGKDGQPWTVTAYLEDIGYMPAEIAAFPGAKVNRSYDYTAAEGDIYYHLESYYAEDGEQIGYEYYLTSVDTVSLEMSTVRLDFSGETAGLQELTGALNPLQAPVAAGMDVVAGRCCVFLQQYDEDRKETIHYYAVWFDGEGKADSALDLLSAVRQGIDPHGGSTLFDPVCDRQGCYYVRGGSMRDVAVVDGEGRFVSAMSIEGSSIEGSYGTVVSHTCKLPDGSPVFEYTEHTDSDWQTTLFCFDGEKQKLLYRGKDVSALVRSVDSTGSLIYLTGEGLLDWDVVRGQCEMLYGGDGLHVSECEAIVKNREQELVLFFSNRSNTYLYKLTEGADAIQREIRIAQLFSSPYVDNCAAEYSRTHSGTVVTVETYEGDRDIALNRIMSEILSGKGPDMIKLNREQLMILQEQGTLADLGELLPDELTEQVFSGVLAYGTIGEKLYGAVCEASISTLYVPRERWDSGSWRIRDVMELMESRPETQRFFNLYYSLTADQMLYDMLLWDIEDSEFVDLERGECSFDTEEFYSLLEFCGRYGEDPGSRDYVWDGRELLQEVQEGKALAHLVTGGIIDVSQDLAMLGDDYVCVGFPTEGGSGSCVDCYQCVAVNAGTDNMDTVSDFLQYLLSEESQKKYGVAGCVRRDVLASCVKDGAAGGSPAFVMGYQMSTPLAGREDGSSFLKEYLELMDTGRPQSVEVDIQNIIREEAAAFFNGDKDVREVAGLIQNRVNMYLSERRQ